MSTSLTPAPPVEEALGTSSSVVPSRAPCGPRRSDSWAAVVFLTPAMVAFTTFVIVPALAGLVLSFFEWDLFGAPEFVGLDNIVRLSGDAEMWQALGVTGLFVLMGVVPTIVLGFLLAVLVNVRLPLIGAVRILYLAPMLASAAVAAVIWATMYDPRFGLVNQALRLVGVEGPNWLSDLTWARPALVLIMIWSALPLVIILYLAALQRVPEDIYSAAALDGAGRWQVLWRMTWPNVWGTTLLIAVLQAISFVSGSFEIALIMTDGGPLGSTQSLALYAYKVAFADRDIGYASALSLFQLVLLGAIVGISRLVLHLRKERS